MNQRHQNPDIIPDKMYFKIGEVSEITDLPTHVLRFWETEFKTIRPKRTDSGQRMYRRVDVQRILEIKTLLYEKRFTIEGAVNHLRKKEAPLVHQKKQIDHHLVNEIRDELESILKLLDLS